MRNAFITHDSILSAYGNIESHGSDEKIPVDDNFDLIPGQWKWNGERWEPVPSSTEKIVSEKVALVQNYMDGKARTLRYDSIANAITYADEPAAPNFQAEGQAFRVWRSLVWGRCYEILGEVESGERDVPTDEELIALLPMLELPKER